MELSQFQKIARQTDQFSEEPEKIIHHLLNLTETVGVINRVIEQEFRGKELPDEYSQRRLTQKLGDVLWYISTIAARYGIDLGDIAEDNIARTQSRWGSRKKLKGDHLDKGLPRYEQLPRRMQFVLFKPAEDVKVDRILFCAPIGKNDWHQIGDRIDDNTTREDGYRFHDVFHLAYMAFLGWSPVMRGLLKRKRRSQPEIDRTEDGARAAIIEEAITAFVFSHAKEVGFFEKQDSVDFGILKTIERLVQGLEVVNRTYDDWEGAIINGYKAYRQLRKLGEGVVDVRILDKDKEKRIQVSEISPQLKRALQGSGHVVRVERRENLHWSI